MTSLKKSHDAMAHYLIYLCRFSDEEWHGKRTEKVEEHYRQARELITQAGFKYDPEMPERKK